MERTTYDRTTLTESNYTDSFGFQWNRFEKTQLDRERLGLNQSKKRFLAVTKWDKENLLGKKILEVGSGAGRFTRAVLETTDAEIFSVDYSNAVETNRRNNGHFPRLKIEKASVYNLPYPKNSFDKVFCFGMLQHTPYPKKTVECLASMLKPGGELVIDFYPYKGWFTKVHAKYMLRPFTKRIEHQKLLNKIEKNIDSLIWLYGLLYKMGLGILTRFLPIVDIYKVLPYGLSKEKIREWVILDTFDMLSPRYDKPQKLSDVVRWVVNSGLNLNFSGQVEYDKNHLVTVVKASRPCVE